MVLAVAAIESILVAAEDLAAIASIPVGPLHNLVLYEEYLTAVGSIDISSVSYLALPAGKFASPYLGASTAIALIVEEMYVLIDVAVMANSGSAALAAVAPVAELELTAVPTAEEFDRAVVELARLPGSSAANNDSGMPQY